MGAHSLPVRESPKAGQVEGLGWADCAGPVQGSFKLQNFLAEHAWAGSWTIVRRTHQTSALWQRFGEGYIQGYIYWFSQSELCDDRAIEFF